MTDIDALFREHRAAVLAYLVRRVDEPEDAADLLTEVFVIAMRRPDRVPQGGEAKLWLFGVARNLLANNRRGNHRRDSAVRSLAEALRTQAMTNPAPTGETAEVLRQLNLLPEADRELITLVAWDGLQPTEAAQVLGIKPGTARARLHRLRRRIRDELAECLPATAPS
jgi:RNA polymerase sigma-70 factor (ECF subfamily)